MKKDNFEISYDNKYKWIFLTVICSLLIIFVGIYLFYPYQHSAEIECSSGDIKMDFNVNWINEQKINMLNNTFWSSQPLSQYFKLNGINNLNCKLKVSGTYNNMQVIQLVNWALKNVNNRFSY